MNNNVQEISVRFDSVRFLLRSVPVPLVRFQNPVPPVSVPTVPDPTQKMQKGKSTKTDPYKPFQDFSLAPLNSSQTITPIAGLKSFVGVFKPKLSFWVAMYTPKSGSNGSGSIRFRFQRFHGASSSSSSSSEPSG